MDVADNAHHEHDGERRIGVERGQFFDNDAQGKPPGRIRSNAAPAAANAVLADIVEIAPGNGYVAGGGAATFVSGAQTGGIYKLVLNDVLFTAVGGPIATFRYAVLFHNTPVVPLKTLALCCD